MARARRRSTTDAADDRDHPAFAYRLARLTPGNDLATAIETTLAPFFERTFGDKVVMDTQAGKQ